LQWLTQWKGRVGDWKMWKDENLIPAKQTWLVYCGQKLGLISFKFICFMGTETWGISTFGD
jgi:hypothetical protein